MIKKYLCCLLIAAAIFLMPGNLLADTQEAGQSGDDLQLIKKTLHGELSMDPGADWDRYTKIELQKATVAFSKHWARDQKIRNGKRPTQESIQRIKSDLSELLDEVFREELTKDRDFAMSDTSGEDVIRITPRIVNLNIAAPDRMRDYIGYSLADSKGSMTLELELYDSISGTLLARMTDNREDPRKNYLEWTTSGTNRRAARLMLIRWAKKLRNWLIEAGSPVKD